MNNPTHYYLDAGHSLQTKNKLQADFATYLNSLNGKLIDANKLESMKSEILEKQRTLNTLYYRCKPLNVSFWNPRYKESLMISGFSFVLFYIRAAYYDRN